MMMRCLSLHLIIDKKPSLVPLVPMKIRLQDDGGCNEHPTTVSTSASWLLVLLLVPPFYQTLQDHHRDCCYFCLFVF
jgi:hypothetical protein